MEAAPGRRILIIEDECDVDDLLAFNLMRRGVRDLDGKPWARTS